MTTTALPIQDYALLTDEACDERIAIAKKALGKRCIILGHHYQRDSVFKHADISGDSLKLSREAAQSDAEYIVFCGVHFMAEVADILSRPEQKAILPDMAARMGIKDSAYNPFKGLSFNEIEAIHKTGIYPVRPTISKENWLLLKEYILSQAPDSLIALPNDNKSNKLSQFIPKPISFDSIKGTFITFLEYSKKQKKLYVGDIRGNLSVYDPVNKNLAKITQFNSAVVAHADNDSISYTTAIGKLGPSELASGRVFITNKNSTSAILQIFHRPVHNLVSDLNNNGKQELVISEFGNLTGKLTLLAKTDSITYTKKTLLNQPGTIRVLAKDMNKDGKQDLIALTSQGDESITILYQRGNLKFRAEKVIRFSPIFGSSWFEPTSWAELAPGSGIFDISFSNGSVMSIDATPTTLIPVPAAVWLFGSGLIGLVGIARRKVDV